MSLKFAYRLAVAAAVALVAASCATSGGLRYYRTVPSGPTLAEVPPVLANEAEVRQEVLRAYPPALVAEGVGARVEVWVHVDTTGGGRSGAVKTSGGHDDLDCAAMQVADIMEFEPALDAGRPVAVWTSRWVEFLPEAAAGGIADLDRPPCVPWDSPPVALDTNDIERWLSEAYPRDLQSRDMEGLTIRRTEIWMRVGETGEVLKYEVRESSGYEALDDAAGIVAMQMRFEPAKSLGRPVSVWVSQPVSFRSVVPRIVEPRTPWRPLHQRP